MDIYQPQVEEDAIHWWEVRFFTSPPFTDTTMLIGDNKEEIKKKFERSIFGDKQISTITKIG